METCKKVLAMFVSLSLSYNNLRTAHWICMTFDILEFHKNFRLIAVLVKLRQQGQILYMKTFLKLCMMLKRNVW